MPIRIEVCQRSTDHTLHPVLNPENGTYKMERRPTYHAQITDKPSIWATGTTAAQAIGNLICSHAKEFDIEIVTLEGPQAR